MKRNLIVTDCLKEIFLNITEMSDVEQDLVTT